MALIDQFRLQYPEYKNVPDDKLTRAVHSALYPDVEPEKFYATFRGVRDAYEAKKSIGQRNEQEFLSSQPTPRQARVSAVQSVRKFQESQPKEAISNTNISPLREDAPVIREGQLSRQNWGDDVLNYEAQLMDMSPVKRSGVMAALGAGSLFGTSSYGGLNPEFGKIKEAAERFNSNKPWNAPEKMAMNLGATPRVAGEFALTGGAVKAGLGALGLKGATKAAQAGKAAGEILANAGKAKSVGDLAARGALRAGEKLWQNALQTGTTFAVHGNLRPNYEGETVSDRIKSTFGHFATGAALSGLGKVAEKVVGKFGSNLPVEKIPLAEWAVRAPVAIGGFGAETYLRTGGDMDATMETMFNIAAFEALGLHNAVKTSKRVGKQARDIDAVERKMSEAQGRYERYLEQERIREARIAAKIKAEEYIASGMVPADAVGKAIQDTYQEYASNLLGEGELTTRVARAPKNEAGEIRTNQEVIRRPEVEVKERETLKNTEVGTEVERTPVKATKGTSTTIVAPGNVKYPARYALMELDDILPSHDVTGGEPTPNVAVGYPESLQPRDYAPGTSEFAKVASHSAEKIPSFFINTYPGADNGPPTVTREGVVLNGNGRVMTLQLSNARDGNTEWYRSELEKTAQEFGISPEQLSSYNNPVLVRVVGMDARSKGAAKFAREGNVTHTQSQSPERTAASMSGVIDKDLIESMDIDPESTFSEVANQPKGREFRDLLYNSLPETQRDQFFKGGGELTEAGKELVQNMMLNKVVDVSVIERLGESRKQVKKAVEAAITQLIKAQSAREYPDTDIATPMSEALEFLARNPEVTNKGGLDLALAQRTMGFEAGTTLSPEGRMMAEFLLTKSPTTRVFRESLKNTLNELSKDQGLFAGQGESPEKVVSETLGVEPVEGAKFARADAPRKNRPVERAQKETTEAESAPAPTEPVASEARPKREATEEKAGDTKKPEKPKKSGLDPQTTRRFNQGGNYGRVVVKFSSPKDASAYDIASRRRRSMTGKNPYQMSELELKDYFRLQSEYDLYPFLEATREAAKKARKTGEESQIEAPKLEDYKKEERPLDEYDYEKDAFVPEISEASAEKAGKTPEVKAAERVETELSAEAAQEFEMQVPDAMIKRAQTKADEEGRTYYIGKGKKGKMVLRKTPNTLNEYIEVRSAKNFDPQLGEEVLYKTRTARGSATTKKGTVIGPSELGEKYLEIELKDGSKLDMLKDLLLPTIEQIEAAEARKVGKRPSANFYAKNARFQGRSRLLDDLYNKITSSKIGQTLTEEAVDPALSSVTGAASGVAEFAQTWFETSNHHIARLGRAGSKLAEDIRQISFYKSRRGNTDVDDLSAIAEAQANLIGRKGRANRSLHREWIEKTAKYLNNYYTDADIEKDPMFKNDLERQRFKEDAKLVRDIYNRGMIAYIDAGGLRTLKGGKKVVPTLTGDAYPQIANKEGLRIQKMAAKFRNDFYDELKVLETKSKNKKITLKEHNRAVIELMESEKDYADLAEATKEMVEKKLSKNRLSALKSYVNLHDARVSGSNPYFEKTKDKMLEQHIDWDYMHTKEQTFHRNWLTVGAVGTWGPKREALVNDKNNGLLNEIASQYGKFEAEQVRDFINVTFGGAVGASPKMQKMADGLRAAQFYSKVALSPMTMARNVSDRFVKAWTDFGTTAQLRTMKHYFPGLEALAKVPGFRGAAQRKKDIERALFRAGIISGYGGLSESVRPGSRLGKHLSKYFRATETGNQAHITLAKYIQAQEDLALLNKVAKKKGVDIHNEALRKVSRKVRRAFDRSGKFADMKQGDFIKSLKENIGSDKPFNTDQLAEQLSELLYRTMTDRTFPVNEVTKQIRWDKSPWGRVLLQFKQWPMRQTSYIVNDIFLQQGELKKLFTNPDESVYDMGAPIRFIIGATVVGTLMEALADQQKGKKDSALSKMFDESYSTREVLESLVWNGFVTAGGFGMLADFTYGITDWLAGVSGATVGNVAEAITRTARNPADALSAINDWAKRDLATYRFILSSKDKIMSRMNDDDTLDKYYEIRQRSYNFVDREGGPAQEYFLGPLERAFYGYEVFRGNESTFDRAIASEAITRGDKETAKKFMKRILRGKKGRERGEALQAIRASAGKKSPLGMIPKHLRGKFRDHVGKETFKEYLEQERKWRRLYFKALREAVEEVR